MHAAVFVSSIPPIIIGLRQPRDINPFATTAEERL